MSLFRGGLFRAVKFASEWPAHEKMAPSSGPVIEEIPASQGKDDTSNTSPPETVEKNDTGVFSEGWMDRFADPEHSDPDQIVQEQALNTEPVEKTSDSTEDAPMVTRAAHLKALADKDAIENAIRHEADPGDVYSQGTIDTAGLVKYIRKRHRDCIEEVRRKKNDMRIEREDLKHRFEDERELWCHIISGQNEAMRSRDEQERQIYIDYFELKIKHEELLEDNKAKEGRITEMKEEIDEKIETCKRITKGSVDALRLADRRMEYQLYRIRTKHNEELTELRGWNVTIQDRLKIARRLQPVLLFHRAPVGTVCEMHGKLVQMKKMKEEELDAKDKQIEELRTNIDHQEREIRDLKIVAEADREVLKKTANLLSNTKKDLNEAKGKIGSHRRDVKDLEECGKAWEKAYRTKDDENTVLRNDMRKLKADQRMELIRAQAENESLQTRIGYLKEANDEMDKELESWENGHSGSLRVSEAKHNHAHSRDETKSLAKALKDANGRANTLQIDFNALQAEKGVLERQLGNAAQSYNPQIQEQVDRLQSENQILREAAGKVATLKIELIGQLAEAEQKQEERFADRARELEAGFLDGFESLRNLRDQWLLHRRGLEEQRNREIVAEDLRRETERQRRDDQLAAVWKEKQQDLLGKEECLENREREVAIQASTLDSSDHNLSAMTARAEKAEKEVLELQVAMINDRTRRDLIENNLNREIQNQRRAAQRHLDLLNEETSKMAEWSRIADLHNELQLANCGMDYFGYKVTHAETDSETLSQKLYGADFDESDVHLLQGEGRHVLLAQLQAARQTQNRLRWLLAESPNVNVDRALSIVMAPRGDENVAQPADDVFDQWNENGQPAPQPNSRKRSGAPLGAPTYGDHEDNATSNDWGDQGQEASTGARISTPEEVRNRQRILPKSRRNGERTKSVPLESIDPAIPDQ